MEVILKAQRMEMLRNLNTYVLAKVFHIDWQVICQKRHIRGSASI